MATKNFVPRAAHEGQLGTETKPWLEVVADGVIVAGVPIDTVGGGLGNVVGPVSAADAHLVVFDSTTGKLIKDGGANPLHGKHQQGLVTFVFDDGGVTAYTVVKPVFDAKGVGGVVAAVTDVIGNGGILTLAQMLEMQADGWEIASHTATHAHCAAITEAELRVELADSKATLLADGINVTNFVYPWGETNDAVKRIVREYYDSARGTTQTINPYVLDTYNLNSYLLGETINLATCEAFVDDAAADGKWMIFYGHAADATFATAMGTLIDYIQAKNISIVTMQGGLALVGNLVDADDSIAISARGIRMTGVLTTQGIAENDLPTYGAEFLNADDWTSADWTGSWANGWAHTTGNATVLSQSTAAVIATKYQIAYTVTGCTAGSFTLAFGGQSLAAISATGTFGPTATTTGNLTITPTTTFNGTIVLSIKAITGISTALVSLKSSDGVVRMETRCGTGLTNCFSGIGAGQYNTTGRNNVFTGYAAGYANTTGCANVFIGNAAGLVNTTGYDNVFIGYSAGYANTTGCANVFTGTRAGNANTTGNNNIFMGAYAGYANTTGGGNIFMGATAGNGITTGSNNIFMGTEAGNFLANGSTANQTSGTSIFIGGTTRALAATGANEVVIGFGAIGKGSNTVVLGNDATTDVYLSSDSGASVHAGQYRLGALNTAPANAGATGTLGEIRITADAIYVCTATNTWVKAALATWA